MNVHGRLTVLLLLAPLGMTATAHATPARVTISPLPGTPTALPGTQISFLGVAATALGSISVVGSRSGSHSGKLRAYASALGASFVPSEPFAPGERVVVHATSTTSTSSRRALRDAFTIARPATVSQAELPAVAGAPTDVQSFQSEPSLHPPRVTVDRPASTNVAPGYVFAAPYLGPGQHGPMIFDNAGNLVWFHPLHGNQAAGDFRTQDLHGKRVLTWWQGRTLKLGHGVGEDVIADANYKTIAFVKAGNGLQADGHEFTITPAGSAWVLADSPVHTSLAPAGGPRSGLALDCVIQRIDIRTGLVMWEWHSIGHVALNESYSQPPNNPANPYDYFHLNSLQADDRGDLLISARNTWSVYDLNGSSGAVRWRLGGKRSSFKLGAGVPFAYQHNATWARNGDVSLFDDESGPPVNPPSRGELIKLDVHAKTATLDGELIRTIGPLTTTSQGNVQALPGGGSMIGWGGLPNLTEFDARGDVIYDARLPSGENSYRVYREPWSGQPSQPPAIDARTTNSATGVATVVHVSWNGATAVSSWQLLTGANPGHMTAVSTTPRTGFETTIPSPTATYVQVRALNASGRVLGSSAAVRPTAGGT